MGYTAKYGHSNNDAQGRLNLDATDDASAMAEVDGFVAAGYRNGTWATIELSDGSAYTARNEHGRAVSWRLPALS